MLAAVFALLAIGGLVAGLVGAFCEKPSLDCFRGQGPEALRAAVIAAPFVAYVLYRVVRGRSPGDPPG